ncbi:PEP-CTERM sorting domain-containing protein [Uliginosibacterium sp. H3]|uniref:PEP-CTERM sorting domain-containing protein n=1 Tax=Uliginosibacterium silvisoli TaxID=3114758 RepID=A0ABU6JYD3_9RHOO|nr:PEP-CTERM sorting domain-containing protein [Uliginosibacterium sp. H3]
MKKTITILVSLFALALPAAQAAQVRLDGATFDVIYDDALLGLFGTPTLLGDSLIFTPTTFSALSSSANWAFTNATIGLTLVADSGFTLSSVNLVEHGNYLKFGGGGTVFAAGQTSTFDFRTPGTEVSSLISGAESSVLSVHDLPVVTSWEATSAQSFAAGATEVHYTLQSLLAANAGGAGGLAFIEQKYLSLTTVVSAVPEASQYSMLLVGLGLMGGLFKRRRSA